MNIFVILWFFSGIFGAFITYMGIQRTLRPYTMITLWDTGFERRTAWGTLIILCSIISITGPIGLLIAMFEERTMLKEWWDGEF